MDTYEDVLAHFGVKGMKWGVRKKRDSIGGGDSGPHKSTDAVQVGASKAKVKKGGTDALSTRELQDLVTRMNLERQFSSLAPPNKTTAAKKFVADMLLQIGKEQAKRVASDLIVKELNKALKKG